MNIEQMKAIFFILEIDGIINKTIKDPIEANILKDSIQKKMDKTVNIPCLLPRNTGIVFDEFFSVYGFSEKEIDAFGDLSLMYVYRTFIKPDKVEVWIQDHLWED